MLIHTWANYLEHKESSYFVESWKYKITGPCIYRTTINKNRIKVACPEDPGFKYCSDLCFILVFIALLVL